MPQQINLLTPILLAPKRYFSALTLVQATGLIVVFGLVAMLWLQQRDRSAERDHQALLAQYAAERQSLIVARAALPAATDAVAVQQQLLPLVTGNAERKALLQALGTEGTDGDRHSALLALVARTLPESTWLSELRYSPGRMELIGGTLDTAALRPWFGKLQAHPLLAGQELSALRVERLGSPAIEVGSTPLLPRDGALTTAGVPVWAFRVVSAPAQAASGASGAAR